MFKYIAYSVIFLLLMFYSARIECQNIYIGKYSTHYGRIIIINEDSTFKYMNEYPSLRWAKGIWSICNDTIYLKFTPVFDTLREYTVGKTLIKETLTLSYDEYPSQINHILINRNLLPEKDFSSILNICKQDGSIIPEKLLIRRKRLHEFDELGQPRISKSRCSFTKRKFKLGFTYVDY